MLDALALPFSSLPRSNSSHSLLEFELHQLLGKLCGLLAVLRRKPVEPASPRLVPDHPGLEALDALALPVLP